MNTATITLHSQQTHQTIAGFGANINPVGHWRDGELIPTMDKLIDDLGASLFRLDPYGFTNWIDPDSTVGRSALNAETYARAYQSQPFQDAWAMARYLNSRDVEFILNISGVVPGWMCAADGKTLVDLEAYTEILTSLASWARHKEGIKFRFFGPFNETDIGPPEGPYIAPDAAVKVLELLVERFAAEGMGDVTFVVADQAHYNLDYVQAIAASERLRSSVVVAGLHCYSDIPLSSVRDFIADNRLDNWSYWLTEYGDLDQSGQKQWEIALSSTRRLLRGLLDGAQAAMVWDAYDNWHGHDNSWTIYGLLCTGSKGYTPKKRYYAAKHIYRFVPPQSSRVEVKSEHDALLIAAFRTPAGDITLVGVNEEGALRLDIALDASFPTDMRLRLFVTTQTRDCDLMCEVPYGEQLQLSIPGDCIFTLTTIDAD